MSAVGGPAVNLNCTFDARSFCTWSNDHNNWLAQWQAVARKMQSHLCLVSTRSSSKLDFTGRLYSPLLISDQVKCLKLAYNFQGIGKASPTLQFWGVIWGESGVIFSILNDSTCECEIKKKDDACLSIEGGEYIAELRTKWQRFDYSDSLGFVSDLIYSDISVILLPHRFPSFDVCYQTSRT